METGSVTK